MNWILFHFTIQFIMAQLRSTKLSKISMILPQKINLAIPVVVPKPSARSKSRIFAWKPELIKSHL